MQKKVEHGHFLEKMPIKHLYPGAVLCSYTVFLYLTPSCHLFVFWADTGEMRSVTIKLSIWACWQLFWQLGQMLCALRFWEAFDHWLNIISSRSFSNKLKNASFLMEVFIFLLLRKERFVRASSEKPTHIKLFPYQGEREKRLNGCSRQKTRTRLFK